MFFEDRDVVLEDLIVDVTIGDVWLSPYGEFFDGDAHENRAEDILALVYNQECNFYCASDTLEDLGWVRLTTNLMWEVRSNDGYWEHRKLTTIQYNALYDWCELHNKKLPQNIDII